MNKTLSIANFFIKSSFASGDELTTMKLIKLCYIAHGWHLGIYDKPLLDEPVFAWKYGPVVANVYHTFKSYGNSQITAYSNSSNGVDLPDDKQTEQFLQKIWEVYKMYNGVQLSTMTHQKGTPWDIVWNQNNITDKNNLIIPDNIIKEHYIKLKNRNSENAAA